MLYRDWPKAPLYTANIFNGSLSVLKQIANRLGLLSFSNYYHIDEVFYEKGDLIPGIPSGQTWLRRVRISFEHENFFTSGLFQEVGHLLITDCDLRVVVSYPENDIELAAELKYLHSVISGSDRASDIAQKGNFLVIVGWRDTTKGTIEWHGFVFDVTAWRQI